MKGLVQVGAAAAVLFSTMSARAQEDANPWGPIALKETGMSIGGPTGKGLEGFGSGFKVGTVVAFKDKNDPDGYTDGVVVNELRTIEEKADGTGDYSKIRLYSILVTSKIPGGESEVVMLDTDGNPHSRVPVSEYVRHVQENLAIDIRNQITASAQASRQAEAAGKKLDKLNDKSKKLTDRYTTAGGASRLATEIAVAIAVEKASKALPKQYKHLGKQESALVNTLVKAGIDSTGNATREILKDPSKEGVGEAAKAFGLTSATEFTVAPILEQLVHDKKLAPGKAEAALKAAQALVNIGVKAGTADAGEGLEAAEKAALDELFEALPPGTGVLAHDAAEMGVQIIEYDIVTSELRGAALNQNNASDIANRVTAGKRTLGTIAQYDELFQIRNKANAPVVLGAAENKGSNIARNAQTRPMSAQPGSGAVRHDEASAGVGTKR